MQTDHLSGLLTFIKGIGKAPRHTGAALPSGRFLAREMAAQVNCALPGPIVELGPGTGVFTKALLEHGISPDRLILIEYNPDFCRFLSKRFPAVRIINGSAFDLAKICKAEGISQLAGIVSGLPLLNFPDDLRTNLVNDGLKLLHPDACFAQFTYGFRSPVTNVAGSTDMARHVWLNVPPATIWAYRPQHEPAKAAA